MLRPALVLAAKDLRLALGGAGLLQAGLLGLLLIFLFSLSAPVGGLVAPQAAAAIFWLASAFALVLVFNALYGFEEEAGARAGLLLAPCPPQAVWLGKALAGLCLLGLAQLVFAPAAVIFLGQRGVEGPGLGLASVVLVDLGLVVLGSLLGALSQGGAARESLLSVVLFPLLAPVLLAGVRLGAAALADPAAEGVGGWLGLAGAFDALFAGAGLALFGHLYGGD